MAPHPIDSPWGRYLLWSLCGAAPLAYLYWVRRSTRSSGPLDTRDPSDFGAFLKARPPPGTPANPLQRDPSDFGAFLKRPGAAATAASAAPAVPAASAPAAGPMPDDVVVTVLYGTEYGFAREVSERVCERLREFKAVSLW